MRGAALAAAALLTVGCAGHNERAAAFLRPYVRGDWDRAAAAVDAEARRAEGTPDALIWRLEQGAVLRTASRIPESQAALEQADGLIRGFEEKPQLSLSEQAAAVMTSPRTTRYRGYAYDKVMVSVYQALNRLEFEDHEAARVHLNRAYERQAEAVEHNAQRIARLREEYTKDSRYDLQRALDNPNLKEALAQQYGELGQYRAYADYVNPFAEWLQGLYFTVAGLDGADLERGRKSLERAAGMVTVDNHHVRADLAMADDALQGRAIGPMVWVVFETGRAPSRLSVRLDIPLFLIGGEVDYVGASFPKLVFHADYASVLQVTAEGVTYRTALVSSMDRVIAQEFENELPAIVAKSILSAAAKAAAAYGVNRATRGEGMVNVAARIGMGLYQAAMNEADTRTWLSLPKEFQVCRLERPSGGRLTLSTPYATAEEPVRLIDGQAVVVYVRSVSPYAPLVVRQIRLE